MLRLFTALSDGLTSALISFLRPLLLQSLCILILPELWGIDGIWISIAAAEIMSLLLSSVFLACKRKRFGY